MTSYLYYVIRHKATGELMPQAKRNRGYSHWNPGNTEHKFDQTLGVPRLIDTRRKAAKCIVEWANLPNGRHSSYQSYDGEWDETVDSKPDGRKREDLEIVEIDLILKENND